MPSHRESDMNQKTDDAEDAGTERPDEHSEESSSTTVAASEASPDEAGHAASGDGPGVAVAAQPPKSRSGARLATALAGFALLLALVAMAGVGYLAWQGRDIGSGRANTDAAVASLSDNLDETVTTVGELRERLAGLAESDAAYSSEIESLERQLERLVDRYENIPARLSSLEDAMTSLQGISTGVRDNWWLAEAEYYLQIANAQLQLAGNPRLARLALEFADERLRALGNPALTEVRRALAQELRALEVMEKPDIEGITMQLASLADSVESLPIREDVTRPDDPDPPLGDEAGPLDRALASVKRIFTDVVSVRRTDEAVRPLLSPDARYFLRANLRLQMQTARLAMLRGERAVFEQSLEDAASWLREYFETDGTAVRSALAAIEEVRDEYVMTEPPDISGSLALLRQHRTLASGERTGEGADDDTQ
jgi:uroporphyrin-3 C-methyltransferase